MKICVIRHGETDWNIAGKLQGREDIPLNQNGRKQAENCGLALINGEWDVVFTSPLSRAVETAQIIAEIINVPCIIIDNALTERDYGKASGLTEKRRGELFPDGKSDGAEDMETLRERIYGAVKRIARERYPNNIIIVSHGGSINALLAKLSNFAIGSGKTVLKNACVNMLTYDLNTFEIECYNKTSEEL